VLITNERFRMDPRSALSADALSAASLRAAPRVARPPRRGDGIGLALGVVGALALGAFTLISLSQQRTAPPAVAGEAAPPRQESERIFAPPAEAPEQTQSEAAAGPTETTALPMVVDNSAATGAAQIATGEAAVRAEAGESLALQAGYANAGTAHAQPPADPRTTLVQGTIIPAVLETALNSELPGFARAIVSRDVRSFDGAAVLIPRGSRLIGQYRAASAPGQSRAYIGWSRLIRPDGVSIELASPALDMTGAVGVPGDVDRHFFQNFGSSLLLSVIGALPAVAAAGSPTVVIGANAAAQGVASPGAQSDVRAAPTIRVPIGTPIQVFTARDLSFE
jgi:type IV secretion system protein VirB10